MRALQVTRHGSPDEVLRVVAAAGAGGEAWLGRRVPLEAAGAALRDHEARRTTGRTVVLVAAA